MSFTPLHTRRFLSRMTGMLAVSMMAMSADFAQTSSADAESAEPVSVSTALSDLTDKVMGWINGLIAMLPNLVVAVLVVLIFTVVARVARRIVSRSLGKVSDNRQVTSLIATLAYVGILVAGVFVALGILQLDSTVTSLLAGVGIIGLALGFAFQDIASNFISGVFLAVRRPFKVGQLIKSNDVFGVIERVNLRATVIRTPEGQLVYMPNSSVFQNPITNYSEKGNRRVDVEVGVSYNDDLEEAQKIAIDAVGQVSRDESRDIELFYTEFGGSSINFVIRFWIPFRNKQPDYLKARSQAIIAIKKAFDENGVSIPFPIRTLDFDLPEETSVIDLFGGRSVSSSSNGRS